MEKHDDHYAAMSVQPIDVMEQIICNGIPPEWHAQARRNLSLAMCAKYIMRSDCKDGEAASKDLRKAHNYIHRAQTGRWLA